MARKHENNTITMTDIFIKEEGYMDVRLGSTQAKYWCHNKGIENSLLEIGDKYCGQVCWTPKNDKGVFHFVLDDYKVTHDQFVKEAKAAGLTVESEFE